MTGDVGNAVFNAIRDAILFWYLSSRLVNRSQGCGYYHAGHTAHLCIFLPLTSPDTSAVMGGFLTFQPGAGFLLVQRKSFWTLIDVLNFPLVLPLILLGEITRWPPSTSWFPSSPSHAGGCSILSLVYFIQRLIAPTSSQQVSKSSGLWSLCCWYAYAILIPPFWSMMVDYALGWVPVSVTTLTAGPIKLQGTFGACSSILRHRLWHWNSGSTDADTVTLTGVANRFTIRHRWIKRFRRHSFIWGVVISAPPVAAAFNPAITSKSLISSLFQAQRSKLGKSLPEWRMLHMLGTSCTLEIITW